MASSATSTCNLKFTQQERIFVIERITERKDDIECENPTFSNNQLKIAAFLEITEEFNRQFPERERSDRQIKEFWNRAKVKARKEKTNAAKSARKTGGGPPDSWRITDESQKVLATIEGKGQPIQNKYDDDASSELDSDERELESTGPETENDDMVLDSSPSTSKRFFNFVHVHKNNKLNIHIFRDKTKAINKAHCSERAKN